MKKIIILTFLLASLCIFCKAQQKQVDSLNSLIKVDKIDTIKAEHLYRLAILYASYSPTKALQLAQQVYIKAQASNNYRLTNRSLNLMANMFVSLGDYSKAMQLYLKNLKLAEENNDTYNIIQAYNNIGNAYVAKADYKKALQYLNLGINVLNNYNNAHKNPEKEYLVISVYLYDNLSSCYMNLGQINLAEKYFYIEMQNARKANLSTFSNVYYTNIGRMQEARGHIDSALTSYRKGISIGVQLNDLQDLDLTYIFISKLFIKSGKPDSAIVYAKRGLQYAQQGHYLQDILNISKILYGLYDQKHNIPEAYKYYKIATATNDSLYSQDKVRELVSIDFEERERRQEIAATKTEYQNTVRTYVLIGVAGVALLMVFIFWRNARQRKKANHVLQEQKEEIEATLDQLKHTQTQLIQSEKMASLGELTAGIAHEIQNPLNFVNNFSDVNCEMIDELREELQKGDIAEALAIANDIRQNEEKINHHGKRADSIVKGMLEHSRTSKGEKTLTNINVLADEFFKLSYHGLRAKDKNFNAELITHFDETLPKIGLVQQDIGRVLLNLFNNAFYAVNQKSKTAGADYKPKVTVTTVAPPSGGRGVVITVRDNGNGIPDAIKDKIMQPFFTTKPTGEGTGLGLSLSYDIVVKGHGGNIDLNSTPGEGAAFTVTLPSEI